MRRIRTLFFICMLSLMVFTGCDIAENTIVQELKSPNGKYKVIQFVRDAGATTAESTQVSIIKSKKTLKNEPGNVFISRNLKSIDINWENDSTLIISYDCDEKDIFKKLEKIDGVSVKYQ